MAQPQHTRLDPHNGSCLSILNDLFAGHASDYEIYIDKRAAREKTDFTTGQSETWPALKFGGYPRPEFEDFPSYFSTFHLTDANQDIMQWQGLADYSNRGFFSAGTNIHGPDNNFTYPPNNPSSFAAVDLPVDYPASSGYVYKVLQGTVEDSLEPGSTRYGVPLSMEGICQPSSVTSTHSPAFIS
jgi:hypothetical protein